MGVPTASTVRDVHKLTAAQCAEVRAELVKQGAPVRFMVNGRALNIITGELQPRGINVIYQVCYWNFARDTACEVGRGACSIQRN